MRIMHLSDIHLSKDNLLDFSQFYIKALVDDIKKYHEQKKIDLILVTGDLINKGGKSFRDANEKPYEMLNEHFFRKLIDSTGPGVPIVTCIGNHDIDLLKADKYLEEGINQEFNSHVAINKFIDDYSNKTYPVFEKMNEYSDFAKSITKMEVSKRIDNFTTAFVFLIDGMKIGVCSTNTAWRCNSNLPEDKFAFGTRQLLSTSSFFESEKTNYNLVLMHHPPALFIEKERKEIISILENKCFDIVFMGHTHEIDTSTIMGPRGNTCFIPARTAFSDPRIELSQYQPGYSIIDIDIVKEKIRCHLRKYIHSRISFDIDVDSYEGGCYECDCKNSKDQDYFRECMNIAKRHEEAMAVDINSALVTYGTDTIAPKNINDIFVMPVLSNYPQNYIGKDKKTINSIHDMLIVPGNVLIIGQKETGKSTLLNETFMHISENFYSFQQIPVSIEYLQIQKKDVVTVISKDLNESTNNVKEMLTKNSIILLIDNIIDDDTDESAYAKRRLSEFMDEYKECRIIGTTSTDVDLLLSTDGTIFKKYGFTPLFLGVVGVDQFKRLSVKWFKNKNNEWITSNLSKLIKVFEILRIPHTFFSVSLFLWIIEKQENFKPINQAVLVETFLQYILEGLRIENSKAGTYNYDRKIELLTEIAHEMFKKGDGSNNYALKESQVLSVIETNFKLNQRNWIPSDKLEEFINKGILTRSDNGNSMIRFRFESFFQYLLSKRIDKDIEFKNYIFMKENILSFIDEIDFYTGTHQDDAELLRNVFSILESAFSEVKAIFSKPIDDYFPKQSCMVEGLTEEKLIESANKGKMDDRQIEEFYSSEFDNLPVAVTIRPKEQIDLRANSHKALELAARILKNCENVKDPELINDCLGKVVTASLYHGVFIQITFVKILMEDRENAFPLPRNVLFSLTPLINQLQLLSWLGTDFLEVPLEKHLDKLIEMRDVSNYELCLVEFIYSDLRFRDYIGYMKKVTKKISNPYFAEISLMKVFLMYIFKSPNSSVLGEYENIMKDLLIKARRIPTRKARSIISNVFRRIKKDEENGNIESA